METVYKSILTGKSFTVEKRVPDSRMVCLKSVDGKVRVCTDSLKTFYRSVNDPRDPRPGRPPINEIVAGRFRP